MDHRKMQRPPTSSREPCRGTAFTSADIELLIDRTALSAFREAKSSGKRIFITPELILEGIGDGERA